MLNKITPVWLARYSNLLYALVLGVSAMVLFIFWLMSGQASAPGQNYAQVTVGGVSVELRIPEHLAPGNENQQEFELVVDYSKIPDFEKLTINLDSPDKNAGFSRDSFGFTNISSVEEINKAVLYYNPVTRPAASFEVRAIVRLGNEEGQVTQTVRVDNPSASLPLLVFALLAGVLALVQLRKGVVSPRP